MIPLFKPFISSSVVAAIANTFQSGTITQGKKVDEFEERLRDYFNHPHLATVNSATSGLTLAIRIAKEELKFDSHKDIVLTTPLTCFATTASILANQLSLEWVDVDPRTLGMDLKDLRKRVSSRTKIIVIVHWGGYPLDLNEIASILDECEQKYKFRPIVIEDCSHAFGASFQGKKLGCHGNICVYSFQAIKHLTTGDGGAVLFPNKEMAEKAKRLRWYGIDRSERKGLDERLESDVAEWGYKFHMNDINATIGLENLKRGVDAVTKQYRANATFYYKKLSPLQTNSFVLLERKDDRQSADWLFTLLVENKTAFIQFMKSRGIMASQVHARNDTHSCVRNFRSSLPQLDIIQNRMVCIPVGWWLSFEDRGYIVKCVKEYLDSLILKEIVIEK